MSDSSEQQVLRIEPKKIEVNPHNPRRLFDEADLEALKKSIKERGVLVPLTVYRKKSDNEKFVLLDGDRRLRCAKMLDLPEVPVNEIAPPNKTENILLMFNIHNVRKDWEFVPTALALETLIDLLEKEGKETSNKELAKLTSMTVTRVAQCRRALKYKKYFDIALNPDAEKRIGGDFFSELDLVFDKLDKYPEIKKDFPKPKLVEIMLKKKQEGTISDFVQEFRLFRRVLSSEKKGIEKKRIVQNVKQYLRSKPVSDKTGKIVKKAMTMNTVYDRTSYSIYTEKEIVKVAQELDNLLSRINYEEVKDKNIFNEVLKNLVERITHMIKNK